MSPERDLLGLDMYEGNRLAAIIAGDPPFERDTGYEPSLLPHLARLCHDFSIRPLLDAAALFGKAASHPLAWPQLWESTLRTLVERFDDEEFVRQGVQAADRIEVDTYRFLVTGQGDLSIVRNGIMNEAGWNERSLLARVLAAEPDPVAFDRLRSRDPVDLDAEGVRCMLLVAERTGSALEREWIDRALGNDRPWIDIGRVAHVLPALPDVHMREALAARLAEQIAEERPPAWFAALAVSRLAPHVAHSAWNLDQLLDEPGPWRHRIKSLLDAKPAKPAKSLAADVLRAHAFSGDLAAIEDPHETTEPAPFEMMDAWGGAAAPPTAGAPPDDGRRDRDLAAPSEPGPAPPVRDERRLGVDAFVDGKRVERALIAGRKTEIEVSIGLDATVQLPEPIDLDFGDVDHLSLPVRIVYGDTEQQATMRVLRDPTARASVTFEVTPVGGEHFNTMIAVYDEDASTVIQAAAYSAAVVASEQDEQASEKTIQLVRVPVAGLAGPPGESAGSVVTDGERAAVAAPLTPLRVTTDGAVKGFSPVMDLFRTAAQNYVAAGDTTKVTEALVMAARNGSLQRQRLGLDEIGSLDRIQVVSFYASSILPLELIYDGAPPDAAATLCAGWETALSTGTCPTCDDPADTAHVCPLRFWGLTKTIEHHVGSETGSPDFGARESLSANIRQVSAPSSTVIGASNKVLQALTPAGQPADPVAVLDEVVTRAAGLGPFDVVGSWDAWRDAIGNHMPNLLIAMPHQDTLHNFPALELGGELESVLEEGHVRKHGETPGPIVVLLGCDTSTAEDLIGSFASDFRRHAPVVIATIGKVVAQEAPRVASVIIDCLDRVKGQPGATIGTALLDARRALLAESRVVGMLLVGHGDGRWEVQP